jgi:hypothetical protein
MSTITVVEGMHNPFTFRDEVPNDPYESGETALMHSDTLAYQVPDWFAWEKQSGLQLTQFTLVYDGMSPHPIPEPSTYALIGMGFLFLFFIRLFKTRH